MATVDLGSIRFNWKGAYSGGTAYVVDDVVSSGGSSYICIQAHAAGTQAVSVTAYWSVMAEAGTDGTTLPAYGADGNVLTSTGSAWASEAAAGGGKLLEVYSITKTDSYEDSSGNWTDIPSLTLDVTNTAIGERFLCSAALSTSCNGITYANFHRLLIDGTNVGMGDVDGSNTNKSRVNAGNMPASATDAGETQSVAFDYLYTTVAAATHTIKLQAFAHGGAVQINITSGDDSNSPQYARSSSTLTVMRLAAA
tara:strand:- start:219 stop:977 length:759 start_codon:yes stop_codon:yes gene_type:complete